MNLRPLLRSLAVLPIVVLLGVGCARRSVQAPPPAAADPRTEAPARPTTPAATDPAANDAQTFEAASAYFGYDSSVLDDAARAVLDRSAQALRRSAATRIVVEGHCDERGTVEYNQALGERRALAARAYLEAAGVERSRMRVVSYGKERPFDSGSSEAAWARNRCAHLVRE